MEFSRATKDAVTSCAASCAAPSVTGARSGFHEPFFYGLVDVLAQTMGDVFPELRAKQNAIKDTLRREEEAFNRTLDTGICFFFWVFFLGGVFWRSLDSSDRAVDCLSRNELSELGALKHLSGLLLEGGEVPEESITPVEWKFMKVARGLGRLFKEDASDYSSAFTLEKVRGTKISDLPGVSELAEFANTVRPTIDQIPGRFAFNLYDTYGFPLDLTDLMARERGMRVDNQGFEQLMEEQRTRARAARKTETIEVTDTGVLNSPPTEFVGYDVRQIETVVFGGPNKWLIVEQTPFYAAMGGQIGDTGWAESGERRIAIQNVRKVGDNVITHWSDVDFDLHQGDKVKLIVNSDRRAAIERHHTVTHLLHWALHEKVSKEATQKGSYVGPEKLTFDFSSGALTAEQKRGVEKLVNEKIAENAPVSWTEIPYAEAKKRSDIQQFFGDKYGDLVRVVQIGGEPAGARTAIRWSCAAGRMCARRVTSARFGS